MRCGVTKDSYSTLRSLTFVLPSGTRIDTAAPGAAAAFEAAEPELAAGLAAIRDEIRADAELAARIRHKFEIKNTTGYRLCAFLDADEPLEIFRRLLVGSEGTLAYIPEVVFETVPQPPLTTTAWVHFPDIDRAVAPVGELVAAGATRGRADGRPGADHRRLEHGRRAAGVERARPDRRRRCWSSSAARREAELDAQVERAPTIARRPRDDRRRPPSPASRRRSRSPGGCARACTGWSASCACRARR